MMERNVRLDYFKIVLSILVITIHVQPLLDDKSVLGWLISNGVARIAVPCFFTISGYYLHLKLNNPKSLKKYLYRILSVYLIWSLIYLPTYYQSIEPRSLITFALMGFYHLWYLPALILGVIIFAIAKKNIKQDSIILFSAIALFLAGYIMENLLFPYRSFCNGVFIAYPFLVLGYFVQKDKLRKKIRSLDLYLIILFSLVALLIESYWGYQADMYHNIFLSLFIICPALVLCIQHHPHYATTNRYVAKLASGIYYTHILVLTLIIPLSATGNIYKLPMITAVSVIISLAIIYVNKRIKIFL